MLRLKNPEQPSQLKILKMNLASVDSVQVDDASEEFRTTNTAENIENESHRTRGLYFVFQLCIQIVNKNTDYFIQ